MGNYNYFVSQQQVNKFAQQYQVDALVKRNYDVKQKMARGDWGATGKGITKPAPDIGTNTGDIQEPLYPWQRPNISQNI